MRYFCFSAGIIIFLLFILTATFFLALLTLDERRRARRVLDCACCLTYPALATTAPATTAPATTTTAPAESGKAAAESVTDGEDILLSGLSPAEDPPVLPRKRKASKVLLDVLGVACQVNPTTATAAEMAPMNPLAGGTKEAEAKADGQAGGRQANGWGGERSEGEGEGRGDGRGGGSSAHRALRGYACAATHPLVSAVTVVLFVSLIPLGLGGAI